MRAVLSMLLVHGVVLAVFLACRGSATEAIGEWRDILMAGTGFVFAGVLASLFALAREVREMLASGRHG